MGIINECVFCRPLEGHVNEERLHKIIQYADEHIRLFVFEDIRILWYQMIGEEIVGQ